MKKVLMLGGIAPFCDLIETAKEKEIDCIVCDYYEDAPAKKRVNKAYNISTTEVEEMIRVAEENDVQGVITAYSDRNLSRHLPWHKNLIYRQCTRRILFRC